MNRKQLGQMLADMKAALNQQKAPQTVETATKVFWSSNCGCLGNKTELIF